MELSTRLQEVLGASYSVERELGGGGMSRVFVAMDNTLARRVVIKVLPRDLAAGVSVDRFKREIMVAATLQHPHIVGVISAGEIDGLPFYVMPFVEGESLRKQIEDSGPLSPRQAINILRDVARALSYAHERGIVHRDIKPDNVLLTSGSATLTDFGVAKALTSARSVVSGGQGTLTSVGTSLGTPKYMAPEQVAGEAETDHRADIYAFGVMAYEMLTGAPPFEEASLQALLAAHLAKDPVPLDQRIDGISTKLASMVMLCLEKEPDHRPQTATELIELLEDPTVLSGATASVTRPIESSQPMRATVGMNKNLAVILLAITIVVVGIGMMLIRGSGSDASGNEDRSSIAVLPMVNVGGDTANEYFADGMTDELMAALNKVPGLRVASRTASFSFKGARATASEIGDALGVSTLLEGTVRREGSRMRLTAQLTDVGDGLGLWSESYQSELSDVFAVQDSISKAIVSSLRERLGDDAVVDPVMRRGTADHGAYDLYLRGRFFFQQRGPDELFRALDYFEQAVSRDPSYAEAYTGIADVYGLLPLYTATPGDSVLPLALRAANRAIAINSNLGQAYTSRGGLLNTSWRWDEAAEDLRKAIGINPRDATAHQWYGENLLITGRVEEAVRELERASEFDPLSPIITALHGLALAVLGDEQRAIERGQHAISLDPLAPIGHFMLAAVYLYLDDPHSAIPELETALESADIPAVRGLLGYAYAATGQTEPARAVLTAIDSTELATGNAAAIARVHLGLGDHDAAFRWLNLAADAHDPFFGSEPLASQLFDPLRGDRRFVEVLRKVNLDVEILTRTR